MAVYEHTYKRYAGPLTLEWRRFLIIPRYAFRDVFKSKLFTAFFVLQSYLEGASWFVNNIWMASAIFLSSFVWILLLALLSQAVSALVKWRVVASAALLGLFFIPSIFGEFINQIFLTRWGNLISLGALTKNVSAG